MFSGFKSCNTKKYSKLLCDVGRLPRYLPKLNQKYRTTGEIRSCFIDYFKSCSHTYVPPCSVDARRIGSYFINSGVSQFRDYILGDTNLFNGMTSAVNSQRCVRLGGKHCDWDNIGYDSSHLSYFEMLGNWSFGKYGKVEACKLMWTFLTEILELPPAHLYVTYFGGCDELGLPPDNETRDIWFSLGLKDSKILSFGAKQNFWEMGGRSTNPLCGPSTEIHWDYLATYGNQSHSRCARCFVNADSPEVVELWNCVFMQYKWSNSESKLEKLPVLIVDTGMGLERLATVLQGVSGVYDTDAFKPIFEHLRDIGNAPRYEGTFGYDINHPISVRMKTKNEIDPIPENSLRTDIAYRIVADHIRTVCVCVHDGVLPGRVHLNLKVRQLLHRAIRQARNWLNISGNLHFIVNTVCETLDGQINVNNDLRKVITNIVKKEERNFLEKLRNYESTFQNFLKTRSSNNGNITDEEIQTLCKGSRNSSISINLLSAMAKDSGLEVNKVLTHEGDDISTDNFDPKSVSSLFEEALKKANIEKTDQSPMYNYKYNETSKLYEVVNKETVILSVLLFSASDNKVIISDNLNNQTSDHFALITKETNMYSEKGGQSCDTGKVKFFSNEEIVANVLNVFETNYGHVVHWCIRNNNLSNLPKIGDKIILSVDSEQRTRASLNHTGHHIVFDGLNKLLGKVHIVSSSVNQDYGRLGFSIDVTKTTKDHLNEAGFVEKLESYCRGVIRTSLQVKNEANIPLSVVLQNPDVRYTKSEKLPPNVRVVTIGDSQEICCGTHVQNLSHLQDLVITSLKHVNQASSLLYFVTGQKAVELRENEKKILNTCNIISERPFIAKEEVIKYIEDLEDVLNKEMSRNTREIVKKTLHKLYDSKRLIPSIVSQLDCLLSNSSSDKSLIRSQMDIRCLRQIVNYLSSHNVVCPLLLYDDRNVLIYLSKVSENECIRYIIDLTKKVASNFHVIVTFDTPRVRSINQSFLDRFILLTFSGDILDFENLINQIEIIVKSNVL